MSRRVRASTWFTHGKSGYVNYGCRCDACRAGYREWMRAYRQRRMERTGERLTGGRFVLDDLAKTMAVSRGARVRELTP